MLFNTWEFAGFFLIVFTAYHLLARRAQNVLLLVASYVFYAGWDWRFLSLLWVSTIVDYLVGRALEHAEGARRKRLLLVSVITNLGILGFFKYFNFFAGSAAEALHTLGLHADTPTLAIILPVGISFYTFQTMAYTIDVYRKRMTPTHNLLTFAVYVAYFPQLVAGPIERAQHLIPQFTKPRRVDADRFASGLLLIMIGLVRKVVIADNAAAFVDPVFHDPSAHSSMYVLRAVFLFGLQIYGDCAGYSDIARGTSRLLGIELMENFNQPYFSTNITEFWRRWHVSLSTWLRDYLYIPLGGNRRGRRRTDINLTLTMLLGGLWHGAAWTFVIWGGLHGLALLIHKHWLRGVKPPERAVIQSPPDLARALAGWGLTMGTVWLAWVFFRAPDFHAAAQVLHALFVFRGDPYFGLLKPAIYMAGLMLVIDIPQYLARKHEAMLDWPWPVRGALCASALLLLVVFWRADEVPFIYFQF